MYTTEKGINNNNGVDKDETTTNSDIMTQHETIRGIDRNGKTLLRRSLSLDSVFSTRTYSCVPTRHQKEILGLSTDDETVQNTVIIGDTTLSLESIPSQKDITNNSEIEQNESLSTRKSQLSEELLESIPSQKDITDDVQVGQDDHSVVVDQDGEIDTLSPPKPPTKCSFSKELVRPKTHIQKEILMDIKGDQTPSESSLETPSKHLSDEEQSVQIKLLHDLIGYQNQSLESLNKDADLLEQHVRFHQDDKTWNARQAMMVELVLQHRTKTLARETEQQKMIIQQLQKDVSNANVIIYEQNKTIFEHQQREEDKLQQKPFLSQLLIRFKRTRRNNRERQHQQKQRASSSKTSFSSRYSSTSSTTTSKLERFIGRVRGFTSRLRR